MSGGGLDYFYAVHQKIFLLQFYLVNCTRGNRGDRELTKQTKLGDEVI